MKDMVTAIVQAIVLNGKHGPYAVATSEKVDGSITFSLSRSVWQERGVPEQGVYVRLSRLRKKRDGWRAHHGRFLRPSDEQPAMKGK